MPCRLRGEEVVTIQVLAEKGAKNTEIARVMGVTEGTVRYHVKHKDEPDGRKDKSFLAESCADAIEAWFQANKESSARPVNVKDLYEHLVETNGYKWTYKSVLRYFRAKYPKPRIRTYRRVETPPGAQTQTDWGEFPRVDVGDGPEPLHAFLMVLSHSRKHALVWSRSEDQLSWLACHNAAYGRLKGIAAVNRIDNVKTAIAQGAGAWGEINNTYRAYSQAVGFHIDACQPRQGNAKGKVEAKVRLSRLRMDPTGKHFGSIDELQEWSDEKLEAWSRKAICPITGMTVAESWEQEIPHLMPLPIMPEPFDVVKTRLVHDDCMVLFENRQYTVPFEFVDQEVEVRGCAGKVQILAKGQVIREYPRHTRELLLIDPSCYEGESTDRVLAPTPLGRMGKRLQEILQMPVEMRPLNLYVALAEVAR
jgi:transposase